MWRKDPQYRQNSQANSSMAESQTTREQGEWSGLRDRNSAQDRATSAPPRSRMPPKRRIPLAGRYLQPQRPVVSRSRRRGTRQEMRSRQSNDPRRNRPQSKAWQGATPIKSPKNANLAIRPRSVAPLAPTSSSIDPRQTRRPRQTSGRPGQRKRPSPLLYGTRLLILGVGIGAIAGTWLSVWDPASRDLALQSSLPAQAPVVQAKPTDPAKNPSQNQWLPANFMGTALSDFPLKSELKPLKNAVQSVAQQYPGLNPGIFLIDLDTGAYVDVNGTTSFAAASTIKLPILAAFFQDVDAGKIRLEEMLVMKPQHIATGSGEMQYQPAGTQYSVLETATLMMTISDNTATNMLIERLGGAEALNQRFSSWGLKQTAIKNPLPDIEGTNTTSPQELAKVMGLVNQGKLVSERSRDRLLDIMRQTQTAPLLKSGLGEGARIANKTGTLGVMLADMGLVDTPTGKRYVVVTMVKREFGDPLAEELIYQVSRTAYQFFNTPAANPNRAPGLPLEQAPLPSLDRPEGLSGEAAEATANRR